MPDYQYLSLNRGTATVTVRGKVVAQGRIEKLEDFRALEVAVITAEVSIPRANEMAKQLYRDAVKEIHRAKLQYLEDQIREMERKPAKPAS